MITSAAKLPTVPLFSTSLWLYAAIGFRNNGMFRIQKRYLLAFFLLLQHGQ